MTIYRSKINLNKDLFTYSKSKLVKFIKQNKLKTPSRKGPMVFNRMIACNLAMFEVGIHTVDAAKMVNRDRTSAIYYRNSHDSMYTYLPKYKSLYLKRFKELIGGKMNYIPESEIYRILSKNKIIQNEQGSVILTLHFSNISYQIICSVSDHFDMIENLSKLFSQYKFTLTISND